MEDVEQCHERISGTSTLNICAPSPITSGYPEQTTAMAITPRDSKATPMSKKPFLSKLLPVLLLFSGAFAHADTVKLVPDHPDRYVVMRGDTL
jgi:hypothetical protein